MLEKNKPLNYFISLWSSHNPPTKATNQKARWGIFSMCKLGVLFTYKSVKRGDLDLVSEREENLPNEIFDKAVNVWN